MKDEIDATVRAVREQDEWDRRMEAEASATAHALIQDHLGPDHKVLNMTRFKASLAASLKEAREQGHRDRQEGQVLTL